MIGRTVPGGVAATLVVVLAFHSGGYFPSEWGLASLAFLLAGTTALLVADSVTVGWARVGVLALLFALALWQLLSVLWSTGAGVPVLEAERSMLYVSATAALLLCLTSARVASMLAGLVAGATVVAVYALGTRLAPGTIGGAYDPSSGYQLAKPMGYANALGFLLVVGITLAIGIALHARPALAIAAGAALVPLTVAMYFTFSRGAFLALAVALAVMVALETERLRTAGMLAALLAAPAVGMLLAARSPALTTPGATLHTAQLEGHRLGSQLLILSLLAGGATEGARALRERVDLSRRARRALVLAVCLAAIAALTEEIVRAGGPTTVVSDLKDGLGAQAPTTGERSAGRLLSFRGNSRRDYWVVAARMVRRDPLLGDGAGSFALRWTQERPVANEARDAHNLYLETLAELGPIGLALLLGALVVPLTVLPQSRSAAVAPAAAGTYVAFLVHATLDWDWEIPLLTLLALACGGALLVLGRGTVARLTPARRSLGLVLATAMLCCALVAHVGNGAAEGAVNALTRDDARQAAADAMRAQTWMPWSYEPWQLQGESQLLEGANSDALVSLHHAASLDPAQWSVWLDLALVDDGGEGARALARATALNPLGMERPQQPTATEARVPGR